MNKSIAAQKAAMLLKLRLDFDVPTIASAHVAATTMMILAALRVDLDVNDASLMVVWVSRRTRRRTVVMMPVPFNNDPVSGLTWCWLWLLHRCVTSSQQNGAESG